MSGGFRSRSSKGDPTPETNRGNRHDAPRKGAGDRRDQRQRGDRRERNYGAERTSRVAGDRPARGARSDGGDGSAQRRISVGGGHQRASRDSRDSWDRHTGQGENRTPRGGRSERGSRGDRAGGGFRNTGRGRGGGFDRRNNQRGGRSREDNHRNEAPQVDLPRLTALSAIGAVFNDGAFGNIALPREITEAGLTGRDAAFATEIGYGTMRMVGVLDEIIGTCSSRELGKLDPIVLNALRMGAYQLLYTRVEDHAAVDTSVRLVPQKVKGFVNAILRQIQKKSREEWVASLAPDSEIGAIAFESGHPEWIARSYEATLESPSGAPVAANEVDSVTSAAALSVDTIAADAASEVDVDSAADTDPAGNEAATAAEASHDDSKHEREFAELRKALEADSQRPIVHLAAKPGEISADELALITGGEVGKYSPYAVYLDGGNPAYIEPVRERLAFVQDEGSQLIGRALVTTPVDDDQGRWLDLCAGPGGKATMIGSLAAIDEAEVTAVEVAPHRADLICSATDGLPVTVVVGDGRTVEVGSGFDRVLVDAPCSGLGSLRRRQESRWTKDEADIEGLTQLQYELLAAGVERAKAGGIIVYSTCSPDLRETRAIVDQALATLPVEELDAHPLVAPMTNVGTEKSVQMWTYRHGTDSMFFAVLRKQG